MFSWTKSKKSTTDDKKSTTDDKKPTTVSSPANNNINETSNAISQPPTCENSYKTFLEQLKKKHSSYIENDQNFYTKVNIPKNTIYKNNNLIKDNINYLISKENKVNKVNKVNELLTKLNGFIKDDGKIDNLTIIENNDWEKMTKEEQIEKNVSYIENEKHRKIGDYSTNSNINGEIKKIQDENKEIMNKQIELLNNYLNNLPESVKEIETIEDDYVDKIVNEQANESNIFIQFIKSNNENCKEDTEKIKKTFIDYVNQYIMLKNIINGIKGQLDESDKMVQDNKTAIENMLSTLNNIENKIAKYKLTYHFSSSSGGKRNKKRKTKKNKRAKHKKKQTNKKRYLRK